MECFLVSAVSARHDCRAGEGHLIVPMHWDEILAALLSIDPRPA